MTSRLTKWSEELKGKKGHEAWYLIYDLTKKLTMEQRNKLWDYWKKINRTEEQIKDEEETKKRKGQLDKLF